MSEKKDTKIIITKFYGLQRKLEFKRSHTTEEALRTVFMQVLGA